VTRDRMVEGLAWIVGVAGLALIFADLWFKRRRK
jgi:hypothetical protein